MENVLSTGLICYYRDIDGHSRLFIEYDYDLLSNRSSTLLDYSKVTNKKIEEWENQKGLIKARQREVLLYF